MKIRPAHPDDAPALLRLRRRLDAETDTMLIEPDERTASAAAERAALEALLAAGNATLIVAASGADLVGYVEAVGGSYRRNRACAYVVAGVVPEWQGRGVGRRLFAALDEWAFRSGIHRLELTVMAHNAAARALYEKMGFVVEGLRQEALLVAGRWVDEYYMARIVARQAP